jgi:putative glutamine amidotransferase
MKPVIVLSDPMSNPVKTGNYTRWLARWIPDAEVRMVSSPHASGDPLAGCDGVVLSGGVDINPALYGRSDAAHICEKPDPARDAFETALIGQAIEQDLPILGICRGMQMVNVVLGGTLIPDLEQGGFASHKSTTEGDRVHGVVIEPDSRLASIVGVRQGNVNSSHHQAVGQPGRGLRVVARSSDGVNEALEWADPGKREFFQLVQWHPERMLNAEDALTRDIILHFAVALTRHNIHKDHI